MCLRLKNESVQSQIAENDIVVYKFLNGKKLNHKFHGKEFTGVIKSFTVNGKISIGSTIFFCTDEIHLDGLYTEYRLGYKYSWVIDQNVKSIKVDGVEIIKDGCILDNDEVLVILTPLRKAEIKIGETYKSKLIKNDSLIEEGIHSFESFEDAKRLASLDENRFVAKCIIPKGSKYYIGKYGNGYVSYASDTLKYVEILT
jgi:hypothetical protein